MKEIKRVVSTGIWDDDMVLEEFSPEDKYFLLYLLTNRYTSQLGIYHLPLKQVSRDMGYTRDAVLILLERFQNKYELIKYSNISNEVAIKNYLRHSVIKGGKPVMDCLLKEEKQVKDKSLLEYICRHMVNYLDDENTNATVKEFISNYINNNNININDNDNDNDNERYVDESLTNRDKEAEELFESLWKLYPNKKGKGSVSLTQKKKLLKIGFDELSRCIERFKDDMKRNNRSEQYFMYGSTFFNSGYVDYLDENCTDLTHSPVENLTNEEFAEVVSVDYGWED